MVGSVGERDWLEAMSIPDLVLQRLRRLASSALNLNLTDEELATLTRLDEVTGFDSLTVLEFVSAVEKEFGLTFEAGELRVDFLADLPGLAEYIAAHSGAAC
jgi:acyl carrier protein